jgi:hypothetical protein
VGIAYPGKENGLGTAGIFPDSASEKTLIDWSFPKVSLTLVGGINKKESKG